jgi:hypothetical protein
MYLASVISPKRNAKKKEKRIFELIDNDRRYRDRVGKRDLRKRIAEIEEREECSELS